MEPYGTNCASCASCAHEWAMRAPHPSHFTHSCVLPHASALQAPGTPLRPRSAHPALHLVGPQHAGVGPAQGASACAARAAVPAAGHERWGGGGRRGWGRGGRRGRAGGRGGGHRGRAGGECGAARSRGREGRHAGVSLARGAAACAARAAVPSAGHGRCGDGGGRRGWGRGEGHRRAGGSGGGRRPSRARMGAWGSTEQGEQGACVWP